MDVKVDKIFFYLAIFIQTIILIGFTSAQSYNIHQTEEIIQELKLRQEKEISVAKFLKSFFSIKQIGSVSAKMFNQTYEVTNYAAAEYSTELGSWNCCSKTNQGAICQNVPSDYKECATNLFPTKCENFVECKLGCCIDEKEGLCSTNSAKISCENNNGNWKDEKNCNLIECQKGCCVVGKNAFFVTEARCDLLSSLNGLEKDFRDLENEITCLELSSIQPTGACILNENACKFATKSECLSMKGKFFEELFCSAPSLNTNCKKQNSVGCIDGKNEIYWFDSCGNQENIYDFNKEKSWNNGKVLKKEESCGAENSNINSENCGNCNYLLGSKCSDSNLKKIKDGNFICENLNCLDENGKQRFNGESWCVYDGTIGDGKDVVGSRHWKDICIDGKIKVEACADYRGQVCAESKIAKDEKSFSIAYCIINNAMKCINYNSNSTELEKNCKGNSQCDFREINVDEGFKFNVCSPKYPRGFDLSYETGQETAKTLCGMADQKCVAIYEKKIDSGWECIFNCDCETKKFTEQMNDFCVSLGDCGSYVNIVGEGTDNYQVKNAPKISWKNYSVYAKPVDGQFVQAPNLTRTLEEMGLLVAGQYVLEESQLSKGLEILGHVTGGLGTAIMGAAWLGGTSTVGTATTISSEGVVGTTSMVSSTAGKVGIGWVSPGLASFGAAMSAISIGMLAGTLISMAFGLQGDAAMVTTLSAGVAGGIAGIAAGGTLGSGMAGVATFSGIGGGLGAGGAGLTGALLATAAAFIWAIIIAVVIASVMKIFGIGETKEVVVKFNCLPWQPPFGGDNCTKCDDNLLKPCSEYRCESLGLECKFLNQEKEFPTCAKVSSDDGFAPKISPLEISEGYKFEITGDDKSTIRTSSQECIPEFTPIIFKLKTDKFSQCKFDYSDKENYKNTEEFFLETNSFLQNHTSVFMMPSLQSLSVYNVTGDIIERFGNMNIYVRCVDTYGNENLKPYVINLCIKSGDDLTPAYITTSSPKNGAIFKKGLTEIPLKIYLNEPAECKIGLSKMNYFDITEKMNCKTGITEYSDYGWECSTILKLNKPENNFYIKCRDQPWLGENNSRNINTDGFVYNLYESKSELKIDSVEPSGKIQNGFSPISVELKVSTSGGMADGKSTCHYSFNDDKNYIQFYNTNSNKHSQILSTLLAGNYKINIYCIDDAGNSNLGVAEFVLELDTTAPKITRVYHENDLIVLTDENAECYYDFNKCNFDVANAESMTTGFSKKHKAEWQTEFSYYVKCKDVWGNANSGCAIIIRPEMINQ